MGKVTAGMTMSLDGFVAGKDGCVERLYQEVGARTSLRFRVTA